MTPGTYGECDPLVGASELASIEGTVRLLVPGLPDETRFSAYRVPMDEGEDEVHLFVSSPHPGEVQRAAGAFLLDMARLTLGTWEQYVKVRERYVDRREDKLMKAFVLMASRHAEHLEQLRNTIN